MGYYRNLWRFYRNDACLLERNHEDENLDLRCRRVRECGGSGCVACSISSKSAQQGCLYALQLQHILHEPYIIIAPPNLSSNNPRIKFKKRWISHRYPRVSIAE